MRVDLEAACELLKDEIGNLYPIFQKIIELEKYTLLEPPYRNEYKIKHFERAQQELNFKFVKDYYRFLVICDGGQLFLHTFYSIYNPDDENSDIVEVNNYLHETEAIPDDAVAIGETNYGAYFVQKKSGRKGFGLWEPTEGYIADYDDFNDLLVDLVNEAEYLLEEDSLFEYEDDDDE